jgi:hypothetical protein
MHPADLEALVDRSLRRLPAPRAPRTLLPRVMAAVQQWSRRPWYERAWFTWPLWGQAASLAALALLLAGTILVLPDVLSRTVEAAAPVTSAVVSRAAVVTHSVDVAAAAAAIVWRTLVEPVLPYVFAIAVLMFLACVALGSAVNHLVFERAFQR